MRAKVILFKEPLAVPDRAEQTLGPTVSEMKRLSDEDLMERLKQGRQDALALLFDRYYRLVLSVALKILRDPGEAEDLMQEVFFITQGLATLTEKQRRTLELACFQGLLLSEIAERMNESLPNVRHSYYRGLKKLKTFLQDQFGAARNPAWSRREVSDVQS